MKTARLISGIISIALFILVAFQSCAAGLSNAMEANDEVSGTAGMIVAFFMLIGGIIGICTKSSRGGGFFTGALYCLGGLIGVASYGSYSDLLVWSILCFIFGAIFIISSLKMPKIAQ